MLFQDQCDCMFTAQLSLIGGACICIISLTATAFTAQWYGGVMITQRNINVYALTGLFDLEAHC